MYEFSDWGEPAPADWREPRDRIDVRLPAGLIRVLRARARSEGVTVSDLVTRFVREAMHLAPVGRSEEF